jgi:CheY-like chemotaxis protein
MDHLRVLVVDDSLTIRAMIEEIVDQEPGCEVVGVASDVASAREQMAALHPNVVTLDLAMPGDNGLVFLDELKDHQHPPVVVVSSNTRLGSTQLEEAFSHGADACFDKTKLVAGRHRFLTMLHDVVKSRRLQAYGIQAVGNDGDHCAVVTEAGVISYKRLLDEHDQIERALTELVEFSRSDDPDVGIAAEMVSELAKLVKEHLEQEDGLVYARIILSEGPGAADKALSLLEDFAELRKDWTEYVGGWTAGAIASEPSAFRDETSHMAARVKRRVLQENVLLCGYAQQQGNDCSRDYI